MSKKNRGTCLPNLDRLKAQAFSPAVSA
jgi:hypothetical protein